jgi:hypothetical protein
MKYINLLSNTYELQCLFPDAKLLESNKINSNFNTLKIKSNEDIIEVNHFIENIFEKLKNLENIFNIDSYYINPI